MKKKPTIKTSLPRMLTILALCMLGVVSSLTAQTTVEIGDPESAPSNSWKYPVNSYYNFSYTQQLYLASDILGSDVGTPSTITTIRFYWTGASTGLDEADTWTVYMGHKPETAFSSNSDWLPYGDLTEVFSGTVTLTDPSTPQWVEVALSTPFFYNGSDNLVIAVHETEDGYPSSFSTVAFLTTDVTGDGYRSITQYLDSDTAPTDPADPDDANGTDNLYANIQIVYETTEDCAGAPEAGVLSAPESICASTSFTVMSSGSTMAAGISRIWQSRTPSGTGPWTTIAGATGVNYNVAAGITDAVDYRCIVTCDESGLSDTTNVVSVTVNPPTECYCTPSYDNGCLYGDDIDDVTLTGATITLSNLDTDCPEGGYADYTEDTTLGVPDLIQGVTFNGTVTTSYSYESEDVRIWIDYNDNGFFEASESVATLEDLSSASDGDFSIAVPVAAPLGNHRMRVRLVGYTTATTIDPCEYEYDGECHDYMVEVIAPTPCAEVTFPALVNAVATPPNVCGTGTIYLDLDTLMPPAAGVTYQWKSSSSETGTYTNVGGPLMYSPYLEVPGVSTSRYFKCEILCDGEAILTSSAVYVQSVDLGDVVLTTTDGQSCGPGVVTLTGSVTEGTVFWYENATGGGPIADGETFVTPPLTVTDTFYATGGAFPGGEVEVGTGSSLTSGTTAGPFNIYYRRRALEFMYTAEQIEAAGGSAGLIQSLAFYLGAPPEYALPDYTVSVKFMAADPPLTWQTDGFTEIFNSASFLPEEAGWITFLFPSPMAWNGTDNIVVKACWSQVSPEYSSDGGTHRYSNVTGQMLYYQDDDPGSACSETGASSSTYLPNALFSIQGCETERQPVVAYIRPVPDPIDIGPDDTLCRDLGGTITLDAGDQPPAYTFLWDNGDTTRTRDISESGEYSVTVSNEFGCTVADTVVKVLLDNPEVELGNDTTICEGGSVVLDAGDDGVSYYWNTGETTPQITVESGGKYNVLVTNDLGCMVADTINVNVSGMMPDVASIIVTNIDLYTFNFTPFNPLYISGYQWDFGDDSPVSNEEAPTHTFPATGDYTVTLTVSSDCGQVVYTTTVHIVGLNEVHLDNNELMLYPNPARETATIENKGPLVMKSVTISNILGQMIYSAAAESGKKHQLSLTQFAPGIYTVRIETDKGVVIRKFEIIR